MAGVFSLYLTTYLPDIAMTTEFVTQPNFLTALPLAAAKLHLRIPTGITTEDDLHTAYIAAAGQQVMECTGVVLAPASVRIFLDEFPSTGEWQALPYTPLVITEVAFKNSDGTYTEMTDFEASLVGKTPKIRFTSTPVTQDGFGLVRITATCGYASGACPAPLVHAMKLLVAHYDENRSETTIPAAAREIPKGVDALISPWRNIFMV